MKKLHLLEVFPFKLVVPARQIAPTDRLTRPLCVFHAKTQHMPQSRKSGENVGPFMRWSLFPEEVKVAWGHVAMSQYLNRPSWLNCSNPTPLVRVVWKPCSDWGISANSCANDYVYMVVCPGWATWHLPIRLPDDTCRPIIGPHKFPNRSTTSPITHVTCHVSQLYPSTSTPLQRGQSMSPATVHVTCHVSQLYPATLAPLHCGQSTSPTMCQSCTLPCQHCMVVQTVCSTAMSALYGRTNCMVSCHVSIV
jgi:hypothetical protein